LTLAPLAAERQNRYAGEWKADLSGVNKPSCGHISFRLLQRFIERCAVCAIKPIARIKWK
jgi:hypothetical protein